MGKFGFGIGSASLAQNIVKATAIEAKCVSAFLATLLSGHKLTSRFMIYFDCSFLKYLVELENLAILQKDCQILKSKLLLQGLHQFSIFGYYCPGYFLKIAM